MALNIELDEGETLIFSDGIANRERPAAFGVTDRAIFVTREKHFAKESWYLERIPISTVSQVSLHKERPVVIWTLSLLIFLGGLILEAAILWNVYRELPGTKISGWPLAFMVLGAIMPFLARGRRILVIQYAERSYKWKPTLGLDKTRVKQLQEDFLEACESVGINILREDR